MHLDAQTCYRALVSRDPRFDGRFFAGVRTTGIYCRPICPARKPARANVLFFASAAAAERAGFRPCRRCRPDAAPGSPSASGRSLLVERALRRISEGACDAGGVDELARSLGSGSRRLARAFRDELGASPAAVARTQRAHLARRLIDETDLPMTEVALGAGYRSVRRFQDEMRSVFGRAPGELRRAGAGARGAGRRELRLAYRPPLPWAELLGFLAARALPLVEQVDGTTYRRTVSHEGRPTWIEVAPPVDGAALRLLLESRSLGALRGLVERVRRLFDLRADPAAVGDVLGRDPLLAPLWRRAEGLRIPGTLDGFELAVRAIVGQQVSLAAARTSLARIVALAGEPAGGAASALARLFPVPEALLELDASALRLPARRVEALRALARAVVAREIDLGPGADPEELRRRLLALPGVGPWTAEYVALRASGDPDAFPAGDLVLRRALAQGGPPVSEARARSRAEAWRPWRGYAALLLWNDMGRRRQVR